jgi:hypothetical protein
VDTYKYGYGKYNVQYSDLLKNVNFCYIFVVNEADVNESLNEN